MRDNKVDGRQLYCRRPGGFPLSRRFDSGMVGGMKTAIPVLLLFMLMPLEARKHRGVWFWKSTGNPYGSAAIVGVSALENQTIAFFSAQSIRRVYGSYGTRSISEPAVIAAWNTKLHAAGMQSQFLLSETSWILPKSALESEKGDEEEMKVKAHKGLPKMS